MTEETRRKLSETSKGNKGHHLPHTEETKKKISESRKGQGNHHIPHTDETKRKIANSVHLASLEKHQLLIKNV